MIDLKKIEDEVSIFWKKSRINEKLIQRKGKSYFLLDGPPYANFVPHVGHIKNTVFKDLLIRKAFMQGYNVIFQPGFDTHGLPVENMVEKKLNLSNKKDIEKFGIGKFMKECKENATLNKNLWMEAYKRLGSMYSIKDPYITYENYYIDSAWWTFSEMYKKGYVYEGEKPVMWCSRCETSLAGYEVTDSYKEITDPGVYVLFDLENSDDKLLVYTTTPWTLPSNVAIAVNPKEKYTRIESDGKKIILGEKRLGKLDDEGIDYKIIDKFPGKELVGKKYKPLLDVRVQNELKKGKLGKAHVIIASIPLLKERVASKMRTKKGVEGNDLFEDFVTMNEGSGLVHTAPGHGKTDNTVGQHYGLAAPSPVNDQGHFMEEAGFSGFVKDADKDIIKALEKDGKLFIKENVRHSYPLCWRCKTPLIFRLSKQLFLKIEEVKDKMTKENKKVEWYPDFARERFDNWVDNAEDWNISRQRYWGIPIPIWRSEDGEEVVISNSKELEKLSGKKIGDLHTAESITFEKKGKIFSKVKGILDVWFDSGVAPWASLGYPAKNKELFEKNFPVSRINEAQDQIRGWFYSLMFCSSAVFGKAPYREVSMTGWVLDKKGNKMSKSAGNMTGANEALDELGADILRYYFCWDVAPYETQKFNADIAKKEIGKILMVLWNLQNLASPEKPGNDIEDKWIISRLNSMIKKYREYIESFEFSSAVRGISDFILNDLSRNYVQMTREKDNMGSVAHCLRNVLGLLAPISPFITESIWQKLREKKIVGEESVHLSAWPEYDKKKINEKLEEEFKVAFEVIEKGLAERDKEKIGLKWPLADATYDAHKAISKDVEDIIARQLNVKKIIRKNIKEPVNIKVILNTKITPELEAEGFAREISRRVQAERKNRGLKKDDKIYLKLKIDGRMKNIMPSMAGMLKERTGSYKLDFTDKLPGSSVGIDIKGEKIEFDFSLKNL